MWARFTINYISHCTFKYTCDTYFYCQFNECMPICSVVYVELIKFMFNIRGYSINVYWLHCYGTELIFYDVERIDWFHSGLMSL